MREISAYPLRATSHRKAFLRAVAERGRIIRYHSSGEAWDNKAATQVSARLADAFGAGWIEAVPEADLWAGAHPKTICTYYRLTAAGKKLIEEKSNG